ncbi:MAG: hypothetical protein HRU23_19650 [Gammaproteobacteria bacterium]|nr:hypothetical protein [Gammaproteobacteria bacterium]
MYKELKLKKTPFYSELAAKVSSLGGYHNAHLHLDRAYTLVNDTQSINTDEGSVNKAHLSLNQKHGLISSIHQSHWYSQESLATRINSTLDSLIECKTRRADSVIDVTNDGLGLRALQCAVDLGRERQHEIDFRAAVYSPLGFRDNDLESWALMEQGAKIADFIACLPERDDTDDYPDHIGYSECCHRMLDLAMRHNKELQVHTDQMNHPNECGTEHLLNVIERQNIISTASTPLVWVIHMISPSTYDEIRWLELVDRLKKANVGVICCPSASIGMRQLRGQLTPTYNSIARILELCAAGIPVRLGSDNIADMLSPSTTADLTDEIFILSAAVRFYNVDILAKIACGQPLTVHDISYIKQHIEADNNEMVKALNRWK